MPGEFHSFCGHAVKIRRGESLLAEAAQITVSHIICQDENNVRFIRREGRKGQASDQQEDGQGSRDSHGISLLNFKVKSKRFSWDLFAQRDFIP